MNILRVPRIVRTTLALALMVGFATFALGGSTTAQTGDARVRITHASPDAPAVDIWVNSEQAITGLAFGESTDLISLPAGDYDVAVTPAGSTDPEADAVISATLSLAGGAAYDVVAVGYLDEISAQVFPLDLSPVTKGNARLQVVHASVDAPTVDVLANGGALVEGLAFPEASGFLEVPAGTYDVQVAVAESGAVAIDLPGTTLEAGQVYVVMAVGEVAAGTIAALPLVAPADTAAGGEAAAAGAGSTQTAHTAPSTGVGSMAASSTTLVMMLAAAAAFLMTIAGSVRMSTLRVRR